jgi:hypothetical protein
MNKEKSTPKAKERKLKISKETVKDLEPKGQDPKGGIIIPEYKKKLATDG